jgi:hypothetical protein
VRPRVEHDRGRDGGRDNYVEAEQLACRVEDGLVNRVRMFESRADAVEAAGVRK